MRDPFTPTQLLNPMTVLRAGGLKEGQTVADFGCGVVGHFVFPAARLVGATGKVYAVDIQKSVLQSITSRARLENLSMVESVWGDIERLGGVRIADGLLDCCLVINNLSLAKDQAALAEEAHRTVKQGGVLVVADWSQSTIPVGPALELRIESTVAVDLFEKHGFAVDHSFSPGSSHWGIVFKRLA